VDASVSRAELESDLRSAVDRTDRRLEGCALPALPRGMAWAKGVVAWELDVPLRRVRGLRTSTPGYVERLSAPYDAVLPRRPPPEPVTVHPPRHPFLLYSPFGRANVRLAGRPGADLATVAAEGRWRAEAVRLRCGPPGRAT
jgi:hypothetical protein